jgi:hypothetical protein
VLVSALASRAAAVAVLLILCAATCHARRLVFPRTDPNWDFVLWPTTCCPRRWSCHFSALTVVPLFSMMFAPCAACRPDRAAG